MLSQTNRITIHPDICNGRPIIANTRITVQTIMEFLGVGDSIEEVLEEYPSLKREDIYGWCHELFALNEGIKNE